MAEIKIVLTDEDKLQYFKNALDNHYCSGFFEGYGLEWEYSDEAYAAARKKLDSPCIEDVLLQIIKDGGEIKINDLEGDGDQNSSFTLQKILDNIDSTPHRYLIEMYEENDDIETADCILQCILYREIVFG